MSGFYTLESTHRTIGRPYSLHLLVTLLFLDALCLQRRIVHVSRVLLRLHAAQLRRGILRHLAVLRMSVVHLRWLSLRSYTYISQCKPTPSLRTNSHCAFNAASLFLDDFRNASCMSPRRLCFGGGICWLPPGVFKLTFDPDIAVL